MAKVRYSIKLNRRAFDAIALGMADGLFASGQDIVHAISAQAPDSPKPPWGLGGGLVKQGGVIAYVDGRKVGDYALDGKTPKKPRAVKIRDIRGQIVVIVGWGFPARFVNFGTIRSRANPFFNRGVAEELPQTAGRLREPVQNRLRLVG